MTNTSASGAKHPDTPDEDSTPPRKHSEMPAEGDVGQKKPEPRVHSQDPAEGPVDES